MLSHKDYNFEKIHIQYLCMLTPVHVFLLFLLSHSSHSSLFSFLTSLYFVSVA